MKKFFNHILQGHEATEENAIGHALGLDWQEIETHVASYPHLRYVDTKNGVGIWYNYGCDSYYFTDEESFVAHGFYTWSNTCGYEVELCPSGEAARLRIERKVTEWLEIEYVEDEDGEFINVIDPNGYNVPLNLVMRVNR